MCDKGIQEVRRCMQSKCGYTADEYTPPLAAYTCTHTRTLLLAFFPPPNLQEGDILLSINGNSLLGRTHLEAIQTIKSVMSATTVRMELIQVSAVLLTITVYALSAITLMVGLSPVKGVERLLYHHDHDSCTDSTII